MVLREQFLIGNKIMQELSLDIFYYQLLLTKHF